MAVHISPHKIKDYDKGMVVVGGSVAYGDTAPDAISVDEDSDDAFQQELQAEEAERLRGHGGVQCHGACAARFGGFKLHS